MYNFILFQYCVKGFKICFELRSCSLSHQPVYLCFISIQFRFNGAYNDVNKNDCKRLIHDNG